MAERVYTLTVADVVVETPDARSVVFEIPPEHASAFSYSAGQFLTLKIPSDRTGSVARCYSLSSAPHENRVQVTVKRTDGGYGSSWVCSSLKPGMQVDVLAPAGVFCPASVDEDFLLFAGGSGITPVMAILKTALETGSGRVVLVYANRDERSVIFAGELASLAKRYGDRLVVVHWLESVQGLPDVSQLRGLASAYTSYEAFLCGPAPFMAAVREALGQLGVPRGRVHVEKFTSLTGNPFEEVAEVAEEPASDEAPAALTVSLDGSTRTLAWPRQRKLLDRLLDEGVDAPYSCREGQCSACACRVVSGEVKMLHNEVLDAEDMADGIVLACQSLPVTDEVSISYE
ncbi:oxidoreductase [Amycolatopsis mediterranei S699]|uniref:Oxidoreductase n=2 Tax=Amycolatopsis mediterranei TaxID=33910 RepID=A0A9R0U7S8_AMYMS|nr:ferredoxin--NADP reductase [Amycolatopsis mediterranei]ADJ44312.1 putative oxidoreductase [Amycolatopsis mediterranei U32]AEK41049.1 oxidoreductase [Amycolatopsis mediterranei S699]AFO76025.1 oxidoreductase [Amycolatopsis mediterranei S699]AGT83154.1 oxidoreductase [Amycolatopsis mediterranei RB]KDO06771.1 3-ketosteroid-9-alpha-hydroxylase [Amycolatopsis mediterranei]